MAHLKVLARVAAATLVTATSAFAGTGSFTTTVTPLTTNVTYSAAAAGKTPPLNTVVGYTVSIVSDPSNTNNTNHITFVGTTTVTDATEAAEFSSADGATCATIANPAGSPANARTISCDIGTLRAGQPYPTFAVFFKAPIADPAGPPTPDNVHFSGATKIAEGSPTPFNSTFPWTAGDVLLGTANPVLVKSAVPKAGGTFFTGVGGVPTGADEHQFATTVGIPAASTYTTATIAISPSGDPNCSNFVTCYQSDLTITIPGTTPIPATFSPYLTIVLRQDASTIKSGTKITSVVLVYIADNKQTVIGPCASPTTPRTDGIPCIAKQTYYKSKTVPGWTPDLDGDFEWILLNIRNGAYRVL